MFKQIVVLLLLTTVCYATVVGWRDCGSHHANLYRMRVEGCTNVPCNLVRGTTQLLEVDASSRINTNTLRFAAQIPIFGLNVTLMDGDACDHLRIGTCPAFAYHDFTFSVLFDVPAQLPQIRTTVTTLVWNDFGDQAVCVELPVALV